MNLEINDVNFGEYDVEKGISGEFEINNPNDAKAEISQVTNSDKRVIIQTPNTIQPNSKAKGKIRIPADENFNLDEVEELVRVKVRFLK